MLSKIKLVAFGALLYATSATYIDQETVIKSDKAWLSLPPTPSLPSVGGSGGKYATINSVELWYEVFGSHSKSKEAPILFLHGGLANSDYLGLQVKALLQDPDFDRQIISVDSRGHGRSGMDFGVPLGYDLMSDDFVKLLDHLGVHKASFFGWSDGAINSLNIARKYPDRVDKVFAFAANFVTSGVMDVTQSVVFSTYINRTRAEYSRLSLTPDKYDTFYQEINDMWAGQPNWTQSDFQPIQSDASRVWIVDADHEEAIYRNQPDTMAQWLPDAGELILPQVSHFAFIQDPTMFNAALKRFFSN